MQVEIDQRIGETALTVRDVIRAGERFLGLVAGMQAMGHDNPASTTDYAEPDPSDPMGYLVIDAFRSCLTGDAARIEAMIGS